MSNVNISVDELVENINGAFKVAKPALIAVAVAMLLIAVTFIAFKIVETVQNNKKNKVIKEAGQTMADSIDKNAEEQLKINSLVNDTLNELNKSNKIDI